MVKNVNKNSNSNKKPAMALVLIIIIITSLSFVIMGTMRIVTSTHSKYSINKNETGTLNIKKVQGRYICYLYKKETDSDYGLYQQKIVYDKDGKVDRDNSDFNDVGSTVEKCTFQIPNGVSRLNFTLIGAGSDSIQQHFSSLKYQNAPDSNINFEDVYDIAENKFKEPYKVEISCHAKYDGDGYNNYEFVNENLSAMSDGTEINNFLGNTCKQKLNKIRNYLNCCSGGCVPDFDAELLNSKINDFCDVLNPFDSFSRNVTERVVLKLKSGDDTIWNTGDIGYEDNITKLLNNDIFKQSTANKRPICAYKPAYTLSATILGEPGDVVTFSLPASYFKDKDNPNELRKIVITKNFIGTPISDIKKRITKFSHNYFDSNGTVHNIYYETSSVKNSSSTQISLTCGTDSLKQNSENGKEAAYVLSNDFQLAQHRFDIHTGYEEVRVDGSLNYHPATLFGSTAAITSASVNSCQTSFQYSANNYKSDNPTVCRPSLGLSDPIPYDSVPTDKLKGAPGAIIIEW